MNSQNIINFLKNLVSDLENDLLSDENKKQVSEFVISYKFNLEVQSNMKNKPVILNYKLTDEFTDQEIIKYVSLGWFIYNNAN